MVRLDGGWSPPKCLCWSPKLTVTAFGDRAFTEEIKVKWGHKSGTPAWRVWCPYKRTFQRAPLLTMHAQEKGQVRTQLQGGPLQARKRALTRNRVSQNLDLGVSRLGFVSLLCLCLLCGLGQVTWPLWASLLKHGDCLSLAELLVNLMRSWPLAASLTYWGA